MSIISSALPPPRATQVSGSSATTTGMPVSSINKRSRLRSSAPPPVSTMPRSEMSDASSGGHCSSATITALTIPVSGSCSASRISLEFRVKPRGTPSARLRPRTSISRHFIARVSRADFVLDTLCGGFTNQRTVITTHIINDGFVETVTTDTYGRGVHHAVQGDNSHFSGTTTDINHHRTGRFRNRQASTNCGSHRFFNQEDFTGTSALRGFSNCAAFNLGRANRYTNQNARAWTHKAVAVHLFDEVLEHFFSHEEVGDNAVCSLGEWQQYCPGALRKISFAS